MKAYARACVALVLFLVLGMPLAARANEGAVSESSDQATTEIAAPEENAGQAAPDTADQAPEEVPGLAGETESDDASEESSGLSDGDSVDGFLSIKLTDFYDSQTVPFRAPLTGYYNLQLSDGAKAVRITIEDVSAKTKLGSLVLCKAGEETEPLIYLEALHDYNFTFKSGGSYGVTAALTLQRATTEAPDCFTVEDGVLTGYTGKLVTIRIPEGVTSISREGYTALSRGVTTYYGSSEETAVVTSASLYFPASITEVSAEILNVGRFKGTSFSVSEKSEIFSSAEGILYSKDGTRLVAAPYLIEREVTVPDGVTTIGPFAFAFSSNLSHINLPETLETIEKGAFRDAYITEVDLPDSLKTIGDNAFSCYGSSSLKKVTFGNKVGTIGQWGFYRTSIEELELPKSLKSVGREAFAGCHNLTKLTVRGDTELVDGSFDSCSKLTTLILDGNASYSGSFFENCPSLKSFKVGTGVTTWYVDGDCLINETAHSDNDEVTKVIALVAASEEPIDLVVPNDVFSLSWGALNNVAAVDALTIGRSCKSAGGALQFNLTSISVAEGNPKYSLRDGVLYAEHYIADNGYGPVYDGYELVRFPMGSMRTEFTVPEDVTYICEGAFANYSKETPRTLMEVAIPKATAMGYENVFKTNCGENETPLTLVSYSDSSAERYYKKYADSERLNWAPLSDGMVEIILDANGGTIDGSLTTTVTRNGGDSIGKLPEPTREGHIFLGWFDEMTGGSQVLEDDSLRWNCTLYAHWDVDFNLRDSVPVEKAPIRLPSDYVSNKGYLDYTIDYDDRWLFSSSIADNYSLMKASMRVAWAAYGASGGDRAGYAKALMRTLGFSYTEESVWYPEPTYDSIGYAIGMRNVKLPDASERTIVLVAVRGGGYEREWGGNFIVGEDGDHAGFSLAASKVKTGLQRFLEDNWDDVHDKDNFKVWICGYSRGAATANLLAGRLVSEPNAYGITGHDVRAFCFECPKGAELDRGNASDSKYDCITNVANPIDLVPKVAPTSNWGFARYGKTYYIPSKAITKGYKGGPKARMIEAYKDLCEYGNNDVSFSDEVYDEAAGQEGAVEALVGALSGISREAYATKLEAGFSKLIGTYLGGGASFGSLFEGDKPSICGELIKVINEASLGLQPQDSLVFKALRAKVGEELSDYFHAFLKAHYPELCLSWVDSLGSLSSFETEYKYLQVYVNCPVDVTVYDSEGGVVGSIVGDVPDEGSEVDAFVDGDGQKVVLLPVGTDYRVELTATAGGEVTYTVAEYDAEAGETQRVVSWESVPVEAGDGLVGGVAAAPEGGEGTYTLEGDGGDAVEPDLDLSGDAVREHLVATDATEGGTVEGGGRYVEGTFCRVAATPDAGCEFLGWYEGDELVSVEAEWRFAPEADRELEARFVRVAPEWRRLAGSGRYDTMAEIVSEGWPGQTGGTVVVATGEGFKDALAAAGLAGLDGGPVVLTAGKSLSRQAESQLKALKPSKVYVAGGAFAVSDGVLSSIQRVTGVKPTRVAGKTSASTSAELALAGKGRWDGTAIIATNKSFKDALSVAPIAYAKHWPILLADNGKCLNKDVIAALKGCGIRRAYVVGGELAVTKNVVSQLKSNGVELAGRLAGANGVETSRMIADFALDNGLTVANMAFATSQNFPDALAGAALCGRNGSVLLLCDDKAPGNLSFATDHASGIQTGYVFGGNLAFSDKLMESLPR